MKDILGEISKLREARKWSEYDLAKKSGLTQSTISTWYRKNQIPTIASLNKVCIGFGISLSQFFAEGDEPMSLTQEQREMLDKWSMLNKKQQQVLAYAVRVSGFSQVTPYGITFSKTVCTLIS